MALMVQAHQIMRICRNLGFFQSWSLARQFMWAMPLSIILFALFIWKVNYHIAPTKLDILPLVGLPVIIIMNFGMLARSAVVFRNELKTAKKLLETMEQSPEIKP